MFFRKKKAAEEDIAEEDSMEDEEAPAKPKLWVRILKIVFLLIFILIIVGAGFALGMYLKLIDADGLAAKYHLADYPVIGRYFAKEQETNFKPVEPDAQGGNPLLPQEPVNTPTPAEVQNLMTANLPPDKDPAKIQQKEEAKHIGKLARLYGNMKPSEAAGIMTQLDDATIVAILNKMEEDQAAKILALFDNSRAGRISQTMIRGNKVVQ